MFQTLKYISVRIGLSLFFLVVPGFFVLYFLHEYALANIAFDDNAIQWGLGLISVFFGFLAYGLLGDQHFQSSFHILRDVGSDSDREQTVDHFERLIELTRSSYFLPAQGRRLRGLVVRRFADYLLSIGRDDPEALKYYLKAFLENPKNSKFRAPLLSLLSEGGDLTEEEVDLLLVMLKAEHYQDDVVGNHLAGVFLKQRKFTSKTEPVFLIAVENGSEHAEAITRFVVPLLLAHRRADEYALRFYLAALTYDLPENVQSRELIGRSFCEGHWKGIDPVFHEKCGRVFFALQPGRRAQLEEAVQASRLSGKLKSVKLLNSDDRAQLKRWKVRLGIDRPWTRWMWDPVVWVFRLLAKLWRWLALKAVAGLAAFGRASLGFKLISVPFIFVLIWAGVALYNGRGPIQELPVPVAPQPPDPAKMAAGKSDKIHTLQVAAFTKSKQANRMLQSLNKRGVTGSYVVKSKRSSGGTWYKIRVGKFDQQEEAKKVGNGLVDSKAIKNYFIISFKKRKNTDTQKKPAETKAKPGP